MLKIVGVRTDDMNSARLSAHLLAFDVHKTLLNGIDGVRHPRRPSPLPLSVPHLSSVDKHVCLIASLQIKTA